MRLVITGVSDDICYDQLFDDINLILKKGLFVDRFLSSPRLGVLVTKDIYNQEDISSLVGLSYWKNKVQFFVINRGGKLWTAILWKAKIWVKKIH